MTQIGRNTEFDVAAEVSIVNIRGYKYLQVNFYHIDKKTRTRYAINNKLGTSSFKDFRKLIRYTKNTLEEYRCSGYDVHILNYDDPTISFKRIRKEESKLPRVFTHLMECANEEIL